MAQRRIIKRLLGQPADEASDSHSDPTSNALETRVDSPSPRPTSSQYASYRVPSAITCLDASPKGDFAVLAGENVFKTIKVTGSKVTEDHDLRAAIASQASGPENTISALNDQGNIRAVKWAHGELDTTIITASANGRVTLYDLNRIGTRVEVGKINEHARQVHNLAINPFRANWLLSASQDGTARLFDLKAATPGRTGPAFHSWKIFRGNADAVHDVKWSPNDGFKFACSTASGSVLQWDTRKQTVPVLKISAHNKACLSVSWHPDGLHLISGGLDQYCHVWDLSESAGKRQSAKYTIQTPAPVSSVSWRPACWSSSAQARRAAQVAVVYDDTNPTKNQNSTVHIWDFGRPTLPFKEITDFETSPTGILWHERDLLWTVGRNGQFTQNDVAFAPKVIDHRSLSTFDLSSSGEALILLEERMGTRRPRPLVPTPPERTLQTRSSGGLSQSPSLGQLSISKSDSEEDVGGSFLGHRPRAKKYNRRQGTRSVNSLSSTPPSVSGAADGSILRLDDAVKVTGPYKSLQVMATGHAPSATKRNVYQYLSSRCLRRIDRDARESPGSDQTGAAAVKSVISIMGYFAKSAEGVGHFRLAQTWRVLSYTIGLLLERRAQYHRENRLRRHEEMKALKDKQDKKTLKESQRLAEQRLLADETPRPQRTRSPLGSLNLVGKSIIAEEMESTSNMNTPLARPVRDSMIFDKVTSAPLPAIDTDELKLPPTFHSPSPKTIVIPHYVQTPEDVPTSSVDGYDFYDMAGLTTPAIDIAAPQRKAPFRLDYTLSDPEGPLRPELLRHDSIESFQMFSSSSDSHSKKFPSSSESGGQPSLPTTDQGSSIRDAESSWEKNRSFSNSTPYRSFESEENVDVADDFNPDSPRLSHVPPTLRLRKPSPESMQRYGSGEFRDLSFSSGALLSIGTDDDSPEIIRSDFLPDPSDPPFVPGPIDPHVLVERTLQYETQTGSLTASTIVLVLKPLLNPGTIDDIQAASILRQYHHRLNGMMLFAEATLLRNLCHPTYPSVFTQGEPKQIGSMGYYCTTCSKRMDEGELALGARLQKCHRCKTLFEGCAVCRLEEAPPTAADADYDSEDEGHSGNFNKAAIDSDFPGANLWWWCQGCGHGGHAGCMRTWHSSDGSDFSDGCCPLEGCLHPCLPGNWREDFYDSRNAAKSEELSKLVKEGTRGGPKGIRAGSIKRDSREIGESRAVESVRSALGGPPERERKKSVKVVAPGEE